MTERSIHVEYLTDVDPEELSPGDVVHCSKGFDRDTWWKEGSVTYVIHGPGEVMEEGGQNENNNKP